MWRSTFFLLILIAYEILIVICDKLLCINTELKVKQLIFVYILYKMLVVFKLFIINRLLNVFFLLAPELIINPCGKVIFNVTIKYYCSRPYIAIQLSYVKSDVA